MVGSVQARAMSSELLAGEQKQIIRQYLTLNGDGTGTATFAGNYSGVQATPYIQPPAGQVYRITNVTWSLLDTGAEGFDPSDFGYDLNGITPGWQMRAMRTASTVLHDYTHIRQARNSYIGFNNGGEDYLNLQFPGDTQTALFSDFALIRKGQALRLDGDEGDYLMVYLDANYTPIDQQSWFVHGYIE